MSAKRTPHIVLTGNVFLCKHCLETHVVAFPLPVSSFAQQSNAFIELHRDCLPSLSKETPL